MDVQPDSTFEVTFGDDFAASGSTPNTAPVAAAPMPVARIDEAGLRAMAWRAREQSHGWAADSVGPAQVERPIITSPLELLMPAKGDLLVDPRPRRTA